MRPLTTDERDQLAYVVGGYDAAGAWWENVNRADVRVDAESALAAKLANWRADYEKNRPLKRRVPMLYTDMQGTEASKQDALDFIAHLDAQADAEATALRQASAEEVQEWIDAHPVLSGKGITASADTVDEVAVVLTFPTDKTPPLFWAGVCAQFAKASVALKISTYSVRTSKALAMQHLAEVSAVL